MKKELLYLVKSTRSEMYRLEADKRLNSHVFHLVITDLKIPKFIWRPQEKVRFQQHYTIVLAAVVTKIVTR